MLSLQVAEWMKNEMFKPITGKMLKWADVQIFVFMVARTSKYFNVSLGLFSTGIGLKDRDFSI